MSTFPGSHHLDILRNGQRGLNNAQQLIDTAEACGIDCQEYRQGAAVLGKRIGTYIQRFFPDQPPGGTVTGVPQTPGH